ncbi:hypothetical protein B0H65DRAFT_431007 [Neurospora tetraspora]|uniref:Uncharacterized protein n=1 Tax=Neurospora tetraspora TaxID=94610 RepID=A0AAE0JC56_9PEZI|nr:hypothetical protein B0H65DRAFT_431007 [Neurospora tetraspora]
MEFSDEDLFGDKEVEDTLLEEEFLAAKEMPEDTLNANGNGNGNGDGANGAATADGGPQQLPDQAPIIPSNQNDNSQPQPHHDQRRMSPWSQFLYSQAQQHPHEQAPINPSVQDATSQAGGVQELPIDPLLDALSQEWNAQGGGLPQQQGLINPLTQNPNPEPAPETYSNDSNKTINEFLRDEGFNAHALEQAPNDNYTYDFDAAENFFDQINYRPQENFQVGGGPVPGAAEGGGFNAQIQPEQAPVGGLGQHPPPDGGSQGGEQNILNQDSNNLESPVMENFMGPMWLPENIEDHVISDNQQGGSNVVPGGAIQQPHHPENQQFTGSTAAPGGVGGPFNPENQQLNQNNGTQNGQGGAIQQPHPQNQQFAGSQAVPEIVNQQHPPENQQFPGSHAAQGGFNNGYQQLNNGQAGQRGGGGGGQFNNGGQQLNNAQYGQQEEEAAIDLLNLGGARTGQVAGGGQFNHGGQLPNNRQTGQGQGGMGARNLPQNGYQHFGGAQTGQGAGGAQFNNGGQQFNNAQYGQEEAAFDLLNLGGAQTGHGAGGGQLHNRGQQPNNGQTGQGGMGGPFNPQNQQPDQFNGMQHGQGGAAGQFNNGGQQPSRAQTPQGGMGGYLSPANQRLNHNNGMHNDHGSAGGHLSPVYNNQQAGLPNAAGGANQHLSPGNQPLPGSPYGAGGVVAQPGSGVQQFPGSPYGVGGAGSPLHPEPQPQPGFGNVSPQAVQNNNGGIPDPNQPPAAQLPLVGSAPAEPRPPPVVTPPVFPPGTPQPDSWVAPGSGNEVVKIRAIKVRNLHGIHPHSVYYYRAQTQPWGTEYNEQGRPGPNLFVYANSQPLARAELVASKVYTASQLSLFFRGEGHPNRPNRHLTLWIQNLPLLVADRYAQKETGKCRYKECAAKPNHTILKGFHRIAFDEHSHHTGDYYDPYNNAGYMHLWCFEKAFDAGYLVWDVQERPHLYGFRIEADVRHHRFEEKNNASLNRDHNLHDTYRQWKNEQWERYVQLRHQEATTGQRYDPYQSVDGISNDNRLWRRLTDKHIAEEVPARARNRANRNVTGNTIDNHRGDLAQFIRVKAGGSPNATPAPESGPGGSGGPSTPSPNKRKRNGAASGEEEDEAGSTPGSKKSRTTTSMAPPPLPPSSSTPRRSTRRQSLALAHDLEEQIVTAGESPLTRSRATFLGQQLNQLPEHLQQDVISHAPQAISPLFLQNWRPEHWGAVLQERVSRMTPYHQGLLVQYAEKTERKAQLEGKKRWRSDP